MPETKRPRRRTWSMLGDVRRVPSEYEIVTHEVNWTTRKGRAAPLEQNPSSPANLWFLAYRDHSPLRVEDWSRFRDPDKVIYRTYVAAQDEQTSVVEGLLDEYSEAGDDRTLSPAWRAALLGLLTTTRYAVHAHQMSVCYYAQMAPSSYITNAGAFAAADLHRRLSIVAYRTRELARSWPDAGFGTEERTWWESHPAWQGTREALERLLVAYDWGESFVASNLVLGPLLDDLLVRQVGEVARDNADELTWLLLANVERDVARRNRWTTALCRYATTERPENLDAIARWTARWTPVAEAAGAGIATLLDELPEAGRDAGVAMDEARRAVAALHDEAGVLAAAR